MFSGNSANIPERLRPERRNKLENEPIMNDSQSTRMSLLLRLRDGQSARAWSEFVDIYSPVIYGFARRQGLQDADAADLVQEVLRSGRLSFCGYGGQRDLHRGRLRTAVGRWLGDC